MTFKRWVVQPYLETQNVVGISNMIDHETEVEIWFNGDLGMTNPTLFKAWLALKAIPFTRPGLYRFLVNRKEFLSVVPEEPEDPWARDQRVREQKITQFKASLTPEQLAQFEEISSYLNVPFA